MQAIAELHEMRLRLVFVEPVGESAGCMTQRLPVQVSVIALLVALPCSLPTATQALPELHDTAARRLTMA